MEKELKEIQIKGEHELEFQEDCERIQKALEKYGYKATLEQCEILWEKHSDSMAAGWMMVPKSDEGIFDCVSYHIKN